MGEMLFEQNKLVTAVRAAIAEQVKESAEMRVDTPGGRFHVRWDENGGASALGQLAYFAEFLDATGLFERLCNGCPLVYTSPNAPEIVDVLGTWALSILDGQRRYAHVTGLRGDTVAPAILGMDTIVSDESLRRGLKELAPDLSQKCSEEERKKREEQLKKTTEWMTIALRESIDGALTTEWILDCDTTVKPLYGHQDGAEIGYNPTKPGRPSHTIHTYWIANVRLVLDAEVQGGKSSAAKHSMPRLIAILTDLTAEMRPKLVRGDSAFGNGPVMKELESLGQAYLFKLRQTTGVKKFIERNWSRTDWQDVGQGDQAVEGMLKLAGWDCARRVVVLRHAVKDAPVSKKKKNSKQEKQQSLQFPDSLEPVKIWEYTVLVTNSTYSIESIGQLYRDRADCENGFDELKNQWGWGGYTTKDMERCNLSARAVALIYNWWSWYVRLAHPKTRLEAITSRPLLLAGIAKLTEHAGQSRILLTVTHAAIDKIKSMITNVHNGLDFIAKTTPQLVKIEKWKALVRYIIQKIIDTKSKNPPPPLVLPGGALLTGVG